MKFLDWLGFESASESDKKHQQRHKEIIMKLSELAASLTNVDAKLTEASTEILAEIQRLKDALGDVDIPAEAETALAAITAKATALADIIPNA